MRQHINVWRTGGHTCNFNKEKWCILMGYRLWNCTSVAKAPSIKFNPWPKTDKLWSRLHIDYVGPIKGAHFFIIVDSFTKWLEVFKCKTPMTKTTIKVLQELFARFGLPETIVHDNGTPFTSKEFENFCKLLSINHLKSASYHPRSNGLVERFINVFKRAIKKANGIKEENEELLEFLSIYWITPNPNSNANMSPAELMFARKIRSVFDKLIQLKKKKEIRLKLIPLVQGKNLFLKLSFW